MLRNRIVLPPLDTNWSDAKGHVSDRHLRFYGNVSEGGAGMVIVGSTAVSPEGRAGVGTLCAYLDDHIEGLRELYCRISQGGAVVGIQLFHAGAQGNPVHTEERIVAPSALYNPYAQVWAEPLTRGEIETLKEDYAAAAERCVRAGFQLLELHTAHGYLLHQFLSERTNERTDEFGGSMVNRAKIVVDILRKIRERVGPHVLIGARISGDDFIEGGLSPDVHRELLPLLIDAGVGYFHVTAGVHETSQIKHEKMLSGELLQTAKVIRKLADLPVIAVGRVLTLEQAESILQESIADLVSMGRAQIADPALVKKCLDGRQPEVRWCQQTNHCSYLRFGNPFLSCGVNPDV